MNEMHAQTFSFLYELSPADWPHPTHAQNEMFSTECCYYYVRTTRRELSQNFEGTLEHVFKPKGSFHETDETIAAIGITGAPSNTGFRHRESNPGLLGESQLS